MKFLTFLYFFIFGLSVNAQFTLIPDVNFEQVLIDDGHDSNPTIDGKILIADATDSILVLADAGV